MYKCVGLVKKNINCFQNLNDNRNYFNPLNKDFFKDYLKSNFAKQILLRRKVKLIKDNLGYIGYIWFDISEKKVCHINAMNIIKNYNSEYLPYKYLVNSIKKNLPITYICEKKDNNFNILNSLGFTKKDGTLIFEINIDTDMFFKPKEKTNFYVFKKGLDEQLRCDIQNRIFEDEGRIPLTLEDIYYDELQDYYFEKGAIFLKRNNEFIGYGQIILEHNSTPVVVNFGVVREYRGNGYSRYLLKYLLKICYENNFKYMKIKVKSSNYIAINLYRSMGFKIHKQIYNWELKPSV
ncbi:GNAT family N-acetyltransferase [Clostridium sp. LBM24168]